MEGLCLTESPWMTQELVVGVPGSVVGSPFLLCMDLGSVGLV